LFTALRLADRRVADWLLAEGADPNGYSAEVLNANGKFVEHRYTVLARLVADNCEAPDAACEQAVDWLLPKIDPHQFQPDSFNPVAELLLWFLQADHASRPDLSAGKRRVLQRLLDAGLLPRDSAHLAYVAIDKDLPPDLGDRLFAAGLDVNARDEAGNTVLMNLLPHDRARVNLPMAQEAALRLVHGLLHRDNGDECRLGALLNLRRHGARTDLRNRAGQTAAALLDTADPCYLGKAWLIAHWQSGEPYQAPGDGAIKAWLLSRAP
jgi:hypothetical protein